MEAQNLQEAFIIAFKFFIEISLAIIFNMAIAIMIFYLFRIKALWKR